jgi:hypothetical protein
MRDARSVLAEIGLSAETLLKIDIEGAEYLVLPAIAATLAEVKPLLYVSFHPFNIVARDAYETALARIGHALETARVLACYRFMYSFGPTGWMRIDRADRMAFLHGYLLRAKTLPRIASPQFGFTDAWVFTDRELALA